MKRIAFLSVAVLLSACSTVEDKQADAIDMFNNAKQTASGAVQNALGGFDDVVEKGKSVTEGINDMVDDAKRRIDQVQSGVNMMMEGKQMIEGGIKGGEDS